MNAGLEASALLAVLRTQPAGQYLEVGPAGALASGVTREFDQAGWRGRQLTLADGGAGIDDLLAAAGDARAHWMVVRGDAAMRALESWQGRACRPLVVLVETGPLAFPSVHAPAWRDTLTRNGYLFAVSDAGFHHFVRSDQPALHARIAEYASLAWREQLQASRRALALAQREAEQARSALLTAQANGMAANARATMLQQQIDAIYASTSWQSTKLLRWSGRLRREPGPALRQLRSVARVRLAALVRKLLARAAARVEASPGLRHRVAVLASRHPVLTRRVKDLLRPGTPLSNAIAQTLPPPIDPNNIIGPQFKTLLLDELGRGQPPSPD
ncbi:hypothetical protein [Massilia sp. Mn16-1_5]|uniref:hypothetical protein n=1 Tax=Massilia sp. Mn16-1_5 TaxID=2079199 RepID=UPI00109EC94E|nr:hypothetical protein [Massilia sp. Mn16-1_5]THC45662.1 hypothetical protein C2862_04015 [Massilia sp. Mn16-1_5]